MSLPPCAVKIAESPKQISPDPVILLPAMDKLLLLLHHWTHILLQSTTETV